MEGLGESLSLSFSASGGHLCSLALSLVTLNSPIVTMSSSLPATLLPPSYKDPFDDIGPIWRIQDHRPISQFLSDFFKVLLPCKITRSQVPGIGIWTPLEARHSTSHT